MQTPPTLTGRGEYEALVVRVDYSDESAWRAVAWALAQPWGDGEFEPQLHVVDDSVWAAASTDQVLAAVAGDRYLGVVFIADGTTMQSPFHALLAVITLRRGEADDETYDHLTKHGREFRAEPGALDDIQANLQTGNMTFDEFAAIAREDPDGICRAI